MRFRHALLGLAALLAIGAAGLWRLPHDAATDASPRPAEAPAAAGADTADSTPTPGR